MGRAGFNAGEYSNWYPIRAEFQQVELRLGDGFDAARPDVHVQSQPAGYLTGTSFRGFLTVSTVRHRTAEPA